MAQDTQENCAAQNTVPASVSEMQLIEKLNHLFRKAGDAPEARLIYQAILEFQQSNRAA